MNRYLFRYVGFLLVCMGTFFIFYRSHYSERFQYTIDLGPYHALYGVLVIAIGLSCFFVSDRGGE